MISHSQILYDAIGPREITSTELSAITGITMRIVKARLNTMRDCGRVAVVRTEVHGHSTVNVYVRDDNPSAATGLCRLSNEWLKRA